MARRITIAIALGIPGLIVALLAKPLILGEGFLFAALISEIFFPVVWLVASAKPFRLTELFITITAALALIVLTLMLLPAFQ